ncbi:uncharacterized protein LOC113312151 [Papaver somniferum]|uniref:uncharacterized protein LOC113312151 n=1 Tax=Papaver somniferum TaxID=3469 RepID=UPI000E700022|nr:uncharacterized protein LOC113312151 [Papaver somniferum]
MVCGNGRNISVWQDKWIKENVLIDQRQKDPFIQQHKNLKVSDLIVNSEWHISDEMLQYIELTELPVIGSGSDKRIWAADLNGKFSFTNVVHQIREKFQQISWAKYVWSPYIHPYTSSNVWKMLIGACATEENIRKKGFNTVSKCYLCGNGQDNMEHILRECSFSLEIWKWLTGMFNLNIPTKFEEVITCVKKHSSAIRQIWYISAFSIMVELWMTRNLRMCENTNPNAEKFKHKILNFTKECGMRINGTLKNCLYDLNIIVSFGIKGIKTRNSFVKEVFFRLPQMDQSLICCDGAAKGNPGAAGIGFISRTSNGSCLGAGSGGLGITTNYIVEVMALVAAGEWAVSKHRMNVCFSLDSMAVIMEFSSGKIPWIVKNRWSKVINSLSIITFRHSYREVNFSADNLSKKGTNMSRGKVNLYDGKPIFLGTLEQENSHYFRFT